MNRQSVETIVGFIVIAIAASFFYSSYNVLDIGKDNAGDNYNLYAKFNKVDGLKLGSDVRISGIKVGTISALNLDPTTFQAVVTVNLYHHIRLPQDSSAAIIGASLLGDKYISIDPGAEEDMLSPGDSIMFTQSSISIEGLIGKFMFNSNENKK